MTGTTDEKPPRYPTDIVIDEYGRWRALYGDGSLGPALSIDELLDACALLPSDNDDREERP